MKILHVITTVGLDAGGPSRSTQGLVRALNEIGTETWLLSLTPGETAAPEISSRFIAAADGMKLLSSVNAALDRVKPDIVHFHKIWDWPLHRATRLVRARGIPYVSAPRGSLEPWSLRQKALKKRIARLVYQDSDLRHAAALHATAQKEADHFKALGFSNPIILSPNGVNLPASSPARSKGEGSRRRALFLSRMHPGKGVDRLVDAWAAVRPANWICELVYTVRDETEAAYEREVRDRIAALGLSDAFVLTGALGDEEKWTAYARADLFVLPTASENFGIVIAEALWAGVPVITTKGAPWEELVTERCGWWVDLSVEALAAALREAMALSPDELCARGKAGHRLVETRYTWPAIARALVRDYERLLAGTLR